MFSLDRQNNILIKREYLVIMCALIGHLYLNEFIFSSSLAKNCWNVSRPPDRTSGGSRGGARSPPPEGLKKFFLETGVLLISGSRWPPPLPPYLKVWICHWELTLTRSSFRPVRSLHNRRFMSQASRMQQFVIKKIRLPLRDQMHQSDFVGLVCCLHSVRSYYHYPL